MEKIVLHYGYHPEYQLEYNGEMIFKIKQQGKGLFRLENGAWIRDAGNEKYHSDWTMEERWVRAEKITINDEDGTELTRETLGFILWRVDRSRGLL